MNETDMVNKLLVAIGLGPVIGSAITVMVFWFWKPWADAYSGEKGKNLARKEDLDAIVAEMKAVTIAQKEIEHNLSGDLWNQQKQWNEKRAIYADLIRSSTRMGLAMEELSTLHRNHENYTQRVDEFKRKVQNNEAQIASAHADFLHATSLARIFGSSECNAVLSKYWKSVQFVGDDEIELRSNIDKIISVAAELPILAKDDLGL